MILQEPQLGTPMPPAVSTLFSLYPGLKTGFDYVQAEVASSARKAVLPYVIGAYAVGGLALIVGVAALFRRRS